jgi:predicted nucleic acid-binding Zn ribbon protein
MTRKYQQSGDEPVDGVRPISESVARLAKQLGLGDSLGLSAVFERWDEIVGHVLAAHTRPDRLRDGELVVVVDEPSWATEVRFLGDSIAKKCNERAGQEMVTSVVVRVQSFARPRTTSPVGNGPNGSETSPAPPPRNWGRRTPSKRAD